MMFNGVSCGLGCGEGFEFVARHGLRGAGVQFVLVECGRDVGNDLGHEGLEERDLGVRPDNFTREDFFGHEKVVVDD